MLSGHNNGYSGPVRRRPRFLAASLPRAASGAAATAAAKGECASIPPLEEHDRIYLQSYSHLGIHEAMIKDHVMTDTYRAAIMHHRKFIEGKAAEPASSRYSVRGLVRSEYATPNLLLE